MADQLQLRGGTTSEHSTFTGALREVTVDTDKDVLVVHDNSTAGGHPLMAEDGSNSALALGSAGTPSLKFTGDTDTGVFSPAADTVGVSTGGTERIRIDSSGNVGLGTSSPSSYNADAADLVIGSSGSNGLTIVSGTTNNGNIFFADGTSGDDQLRGFIQYNHQLDFFNIGTNATSAIRIDSSQRVGIGTNAPTAQLEIGGIPSSGSAEDAFTISRSDGTQLFSVNYNSGNNTVGISGNNKEFAFTNKSAFGESLRIDGSGRLLVNISSPIETAAVSSKIQAATSVGAFLILARNDTTVSDGASLGGVRFFGNDSNGTYEECAIITASADGTHGTGDKPTRLTFSTTASGASSPTERMRIDSQGRVYVKDSIILETVGKRLFFDNSTAASIGSSSSGGSTTTLYIGNAAIQVSSDIRLKENIEDTNLDALNAISRINVKDFTWNDPTDTSPNNRNARGKWTGLIAQELVEVLPFVVNAPRKEEDGSIDYESEDRWTLDQSQLCPVLIKAVQQQQETIVSLEARLSALEAQ